MFIDNVNIAQSTRKQNDKGFLSVELSLTSVGVQQYRGEAIMQADQSLDPTRLYNVYRPAAVVFDAQTIESAKLKSLLLGHPATGENVTINTIDTMPVVGSTGENARALNDNELGINGLIDRPNGITALNDGVSGVSVGYESDIKKESGVYNGIAYDFIFSSPMIIDHVAMTPTPRVPNAKILDEDDKVTLKKEDKKLSLSDEDVKKIADGLDVNGLSDKIVSALSPTFEKLASDADFQALVADKVAANITSSMGGGDGDENVDDVNNPEQNAPPPPTQQPEQQNKVNTMDAIAERAEVISIVSRLTDSTVDATKNSRELLLNAVCTFDAHDKDALKHKSVGYLTRLAEELNEKRASNKLNDSVGKTRSYNDDDNSRLDQVHDAHISAMEIHHALQISNRSKL